MMSHVQKVSYSKRTAFIKDHNQKGPKSKGSIFNRDHIPKGTGLLKKTSEIEIIL